VSTKAIFWLSVFLGSTLLALILGASLMLYAENLAHPAIVFPQANRGSFARVAVLMDGTRSVGTPNYVTIQEIVQEKVIPGLGINDIALAYDVQRIFETSNNLVFGLARDQMPQDERRQETLAILARNRQAKAVDDDLYELLRALAPLEPRVEQTRKAWAQRVQDRPQPKPLGSDICGPLTDIGRFLSRGEPDAERWVFVLSDLRNDTPGKTCPVEEPFPEAHVVLVYPFASDSAKWQTVEGFWSGVFGKQELERVTFSAALADGLLMPPNPLEGLARQAPAANWDYARPLLGRFLFGWLGGTVGIGLIAALALFRRKPRTLVTAGPA